MILENIGLAFSSLKSNKMRSLLTMLGIIIGIASVIAIVSIGDSIEYSVNDSMSGFGTNQITINIQERSNSSIFEQMGMGMMVYSRAKEPGSSDMFSSDEVDEFLTDFSDTIDYVSLSHNVGPAKVQDKELYANVSVVGANPGYIKYNSLTMVSGRELYQEDLDNVANVALVSDKMVKNMGLNPMTAVGEQIKVYHTSSIEIYTIVGVYEYVSNGFISYASEENISTTLFIPITTAKKDLIEKNFQSFTAFVKVGEDVNAETAKIQNYFDGIYSTNEDWRVSVSNMTTMLDTLNSTMDTITIGIAFIAAISLIVGGIGVMNIMLVSVTERTREIGTRKALGAKTFHIQMQFLIESVIVTLIGGIIGIIFGVAMAAIALTLLDMQFVISAEIVVISITFSAIIGIFFGLYPASKAAKLDPIEALRYE